MIALECVNAVKTFLEDDEDSPRPLWRSLMGAKKRRVTAVNEISFTVPKGEIFGILGPNGSGKSTLIRLISTLVIPDKGEVRVFGHNVVKNRMAVRHLINRVSVDAAFFKKLSALENLSYAARLYGMDVTEARRRPRGSLSVLGLSGRKLGPRLRASPGGSSRRWQSPGL